MRYVRKPISVSVFVEKGCDIPVVVILKVVTALIGSDTSEVVMVLLELTGLAFRVLVTNSVSPPGMKPKIMFTVVFATVTTLEGLGLLVSRGVVSDIISKLLTM